LSFFSSDRTIAYAAAVKPFVDAVNGDGEASWRSRVADEFAAKSAHNAELVRAAHAVLVDIRTGK
jgi:hypothetical protein